MVQASRLRFQEQAGRLHHKLYHDPPPGEAGKVIVVVLSDLGELYLSTALYPQE